MIEYCVYSYHRLEAICQKNNQWQVYEESTLIDNIKALQPFHLNIVLVTLPAN